MESKWHDLSDLTTETPERTSLTDEELMRAFEELTGETAPKTDLSDADEALYGAWEILSGDKTPGGTTMLPETTPRPKPTGQEMSDDEIFEQARSLTNWED